MEFFWTIVEILATVFENYVAIDFLGRVLGYRYDNLKRKSIFILSIVFLSIVVTLINKITIYEGFLTLLVIVILVIYSIIFLQGKLLHKFLLSISIIGIIAVINFLIISLFSVIYGFQDDFFFTNNNYIRLIGIILSKSLYFFVCRTVANLLKRNNLELNSKEYWLSILLFLISQTLIISLTKVQIGTVYSKQLLIFSMCGIFVMNIFVIYIIYKMSKENKNKLKISMLEFQLSQSKDIFNDASYISKEVRKTEHDLKHHLSAIRGLLKNDLEAISYIDNLIENYQTNLFNYISTNNSIINSIVNLKIARCNELKIDTKIAIDSEFTGIDDIDICVLLSNLLDNAIEAESKMNSKQICINMYNEKNYLCIVVRNKIDKSILKENPNLLTSKSDKINHGLGNYSVSQIIEKYNGTKNIYEKNGYFVVDVWIENICKNT